LVQFAGFTGFGLGLKTGFVATSPGDCLFRLGPSV